MKLAEALKYDAKGLRFDNSGNSDTTNKLHSAIRAYIKNNDRTALAGIADLLAENDHPFAPFIGRLFNGEGRLLEGNPTALLNAFAKRSKDDEHGGSLIAYAGNQWDTENNRPKKTPAIRVTPVSLKDGQHHVLIDFTGDDYAEGPHLILPSSPEEIADYAHRAAEVYPEHSKSLLEGDSYGESEYARSPRNENYIRRQYGLPELPEEPEQHRSIKKALKYVSAKPEDMLHLLHHPGNESSLIWADLLDDHNYSDLAARVRKEAEGSAVKRPLPEEGSSSHDEVQHRLHLRHPSPAIRALADGGKSSVSTDYLVRALRLSPNHFDQDAGVWLAKEERPHKQHAALTHLATLSNAKYNAVGLIPKLVGDTLYLLDWEHTPEEYAQGYHAPAIRYHAPVSDRKDLDGMIAHAEELRQQREEQGL